MYDITIQLHLAQHVNTPILFILTADKYDYK